MAIMGVIPKYMVLFTPEAIDPSDGQFNGKLIKLLFGYPDPKDGWQFDTAAAAHKEAQDNDYRKGVDYIVVRVLK
jgi:hypothetical protein